MLAVLQAVEGFEWDAHNVHKIRQRHRVDTPECEEVFFDYLLVLPDAGHSLQEPRFHALGYTAQGRRLFLVFTVRQHRIRVISARDMSRKERRIYDNAKEKDRTCIEE